MTPLAEEAVVGGSKVIEIRFHGRGGQGLVTAAHLLARAATLEGKRAHSFPSFGAERRGAPVLGFVRISDSPIRIKQQIYEPDVVVVVDPTIYRSVPVGAGLKENGMILVNSAAPIDDIGKLLNTSASVFVVDATSIAVKVLGRPVTNTVMLGAFARISPVVSLASLEKAVMERFGDGGAVNVRAMQIGYEAVAEQ